MERPIDAEEREETLALARWFTSRYRTAEARLAYVRHAYARWARALSHFTSAVEDAVATRSPKAYDSVSDMATLPPYAAVWIEQWRAAGPALAAQRHHELSTATFAEALAATTDLLDAAPPCSPRDPRWHTSGLIELQRLLHTDR